MSAMHTVAWPQTSWNIYLCISRPIPKPVEFNIAKNMNILILLMHEDCNINNGIK